MRNENAGLFRRFAHAEHIMLAGSMPATAAGSVAALSAEPAAAVVASRQGSRLVRRVAPLTATVSERVAVNG